MAITLGINIASLMAQRRLAESSKELSQTYTRLSSGLRINGASDDAAGLAIASKLKSDARVYGQAVRNINDGISAASIAQGALEQLQVISMRQRELATQAANGSYSTKQRQALNAETNQLVEEYNRIVASTEFNGQKLLSPTLGNISIQAGIGANATLSLDSTSALLRNVGDGTFGTATMFATGGAVSDDVSVGDFNNDGKLDLLEMRLVDQKLVVRFGNGDGTFQAGIGTAYGGGGAYDMATGDFNGDGRLDVALRNDTFLVYTGNGDGTFTFSSSGGGLSMPNSMFAVDVNGDSKLDLVASQGAPLGVAVRLGNGDGSFGAVQTLWSSTSWAYDVVVGDFNNDGKVDVASADHVSRSFSLFLNRGNGTFDSPIVTTAGSVGVQSYLEAGDFNRDGYLDIYATSNDVDRLYFGNGDGTFQLAQTTTKTSDAIAGDINGDGIPDLVTRGSNGLSVLLGSANGTLSPGAGYPSHTSVEQFTMADLNRDGRLDLITAEGAAGIGVFLANGTQTTSTPYLNICTRQGALDAMAVIDKNIERVSSQLGLLGAAQSRMSSAANTLLAARDNFETAASRIMDADIAAEAARLASEQIRQQIASSILAQANQQPQIALTLLKNLL